MATSNPPAVHAHRRRVLWPSVVGGVILALVLPARAMTAPASLAADSGWSAAIQVDPGGQGSVCPGAWDVDVASSPQGDITVVWTGGAGDTLFLCSRMKPHGEPWLPVERIWESESYVWTPRVVGDGHGRWMAFWSGYSAAAGTQVMAARYTSGSGWSKPVALSPRNIADSLQITGLDVAMNARGDAVAAWGWNDIDGYAHPRAQFNYRPADGHWQGFHQIAGTYKASVGIAPGGGALVLSSDHKHIFVVRHHGTGWLRPRTIAREAIWRSPSRVAMTDDSAIAAWAILKEGAYVVRASRLAHGRWSTPRSLSRRMTRDAWDRELVMGMTRRGGATIAWGRGSHLVVSGVTATGSWQEAYDAARFTGYYWQLAMSPAGDAAIAGKEEAIYRPAGHRWRDPIALPTSDDGSEFGVGIDNRGRASVAWTSDSFEDGAYYGAYLLRHAPVR